MAAIAAKNINSGPLSLLNHGAPGPASHVGTLKRRPENTKSIQDQAAGRCLVLELVIFQCQQASPLPRHGPGSREKTGSDRDDPDAVSRRSESR